MDIEMKNEIPKTDMKGETILSCNMEEKISPSNVSKTISSHTEKASSTLNELKNFRITRKREFDETVINDTEKKSETSDEKIITTKTVSIRSPVIAPSLTPLLLQSSPSKQLRLDNAVAERKSIIQVHIANDEIKKIQSTEIDKIDDTKLDIISDTKQITLETVKEQKETTNVECEDIKKETTSDIKLQDDYVKEENLPDTIVKTETISSEDNINNLSVDNLNNLSLDNAKNLNSENVIDNMKNIEELQQEQQQQQQQQEHQQQQAQYLRSLEKLTIEEEMKDQKYRETCEVFLQHLPCFKLESNEDNTATLLPNTIIPVRIPKCRECRRRTPQQGSNDVYCRFYEFRCLQYTNDGKLLIAGFPDPYKDATREDMNTWQPDENTEPTAGNMDIQVCRYILLHVGDQFCHLWRQELEALKLHENPNRVIAWKKVVQGIREICDVCDTTLFNFHWTCDKCGFGVCLDCFKDRKSEKKRKTFVRDKPQKGRDEYYWLLCTNGSIHNVKELILTQIIVGDALNYLGGLLHDIRLLWEIPQLCGCLLSKQKLPNGDWKSFIQDMIKESQLKQQTTASSLATEETKRKQERLDQIHAKTLAFAKSRDIDYVPGRICTKKTLGKDPITTAFDKFKHINFLRKGLTGYRRFLPPHAMTITHSTLLASDVPHEWHDGRLLRLTNPKHPDNRILFQEVWKCGQPVMISEVAKSLNLELWRPEAFLRDFGDKPNDLINCLNGNLVPNQPMRHFWEGFQCMNKRLLDANGKPMLLKLKDWPPGDDFAEILPTRYQDLMQGLPMPEYTLRTGNLNIASCLPKMFVPPDLGPKMYNAYGSAFHPDKGTTNLHLDISDAVNIMVYVGIPNDIDSTAQIAASHRAIAMGGCKFLMRGRVLDKNCSPGALWHIFPARDADKIRDLLNRVTLESGYRLEPDHDPIHDQNWYLDDKLRERLFNEYGVEGYPIVQCLGDAVFIPAGAPHQVQNLHNCIKVAEDFVSPENITHCLHLTQEFRLLSHSHTNHEDKLQIKNIVYHAIKDCCTILKRAMETRIEQVKAEIEAKLQKNNSANVSPTTIIQQEEKQLDEIDKTVKTSDNEIPYSEPIDSSLNIESTSHSVPNEISSLTVNGDKTLDKTINENQILIQTDAILNSANEIKPTSPDVMANEIIMDNESSDNNSSSTTNEQENNPVEEQLNSGNIESETLLDSNDATLGSSSTSKDELNHTFNEEALNETFNNDINSKEATENDKSNLSNDEEDTLNHNMTESLSLKEADAVPISISNNIGIDIVETDPRNVNEKANCVSNVENPETKEIIVPSIDVSLEKSEKSEKSETSETSDSN